MKIFLSYKIQKYMQFSASFSLLIFTLSFVSQAYADISLPDAGRVVNELQTLQSTAVVDKQEKDFFQNQTESQAYSQDQTPIFVRAVIIEGNTAITSNQLHPLIQHLESNNNTLADLQRATQELTQYYHEQGYFLARAYLPKQQLDQDILTIKVIEGSLGGVNVQNHSNVPIAVIQNYLNQIPLNHALKEKTANRVLLLISDLAGIGATQASLEAGQQTGQTNLNLDLQGSKTYSGRVGLDNAGSTYTGQYRLSNYIETNSLFGYGEKLAAQLLLSNHDLRSGSLSGQFPVFSHGLVLGVNAGRTEYDLGQQFTILDAHGTSENVGVNLSYPMIRSQTLNARIKLNLDYRQLEDEIAATETKTNKSNQITRVTLSLDQRDTYGFGQSRGGLNQLNFTVSTGKLDIESASARRIDQLSAKTNGVFQKYELSLSRQQILTERMRASLYGYGQLSSKNLDSSEKFSFNAMRAYPSSEGLGDQGWGASVNVDYQLYPVVDLYLFNDLGKTYENKHPYLQEKNKRYLSSTGFGMRGAYKQFDYNATVGWHNTSAAISDKDKKPRILAQIGWIF